MLCKLCNLMRIAYFLVKVHSDQINGKRFCQSKACWFLCAIMQLANLNCIWITTLSDAYNNFPRPVLLRCVFLLISNTCMTPSSKSSITINIGLKWDHTRSNLPYLHIDIIHRRLTCSIVSLTTTYFFDGNCFTLHFTPCSGVVFRRVHAQIYTVTNTPRWFQGFHLQWNKPLRRPPSKYLPNKIPYITTRALI